MKLLKQLGGDALVYGFGGAIAKGLSFLLLPIYTRIFTPAEYGTMEMLVVISSFVSAVLVLGMDSAQSMYFFKVKKDGIQTQAKIVSAILQIRLIWGCIVVLLASLLSPFLNLWFFNGVLGLEYFAIAFCGALFVQVMVQSAELMRLLYRPWDYIGIIILQSILSATTGLICIIILDLGVLGFFIGILISATMVGLFGWFRIRDYWEFKNLHWHIFPRLIRFGLPLMPAALVFYFMSTADRWFVQYFHGAAALGIFAAGAKLALILSLVIETFRQAWWPFAMDSMHTDSGAETFKIIARLYLGIACAGVVMLTYLSPWLVYLMAGSNYQSAWTIVGVLAGQGVFYGFFNIGNAGIWKSEKTYLNLPLLIGAAILGLVLNYLLVPKYAGLGAAVATVVTYFVWIAATILVSQNLWKIDYQFNVMFAQVVSTTLFVVLFITFFKGEHTFLTSLTTLSVFLFLTASSLSQKYMREIFFSISKRFLRN